MAIKKQTFMKGVLVIIGSQILIKILGFIYRVVLTNFKEFADTGNSFYGSGYKVYMFILAIATMGIPNTISKLVSEKVAIGDRRGAHRIFKTAFAMFVLVGLFFASVLFFGADYISVNLLANPGVKLTLMVLAPSVIFVSIAAVFKGYFIGLSNMTIHSTAQVIDQIVNSIFSIAFVAMLLGTTPEVMAAGSTLATTVATFSSMMYVVLYYVKNKKSIWQEVKESDKFATEERKKVVKKIIKYVIPLSFGSIIVTLAGMIDLVTVMQGLQLHGETLEEANKLFGILMGKVDILTSLPLSLNVAFSTALVPAVSAAIAINNKESAVKKINFSLKMSSLLAFPCAVGLCILAGPILQLIFPNAADGSVQLQIAAWTVVFSVIAQTAYGGLNGMGKLIFPGLCLAAGVVIKYILNVTLIPIYGINMASLSTVIYQMIAAILAVSLLYHFLKQKPDLKSMLLKPIIASILMGIVTFLSYKVLVNITCSNTIATLVSICIAIFTYVLAIILLKTMKKDEIEQLPYGNKINGVIEKFIKNY